MIRQLRLWLAQKLLPKDLTTTGVGEQQKLLDTIREMEKRIETLAEHYADLEKRGS